jgi:hypothetical protein
MIRWNARVSTYYTFVCQIYDYHFFDYHFFDKKLCLYLIIAYLCSRKGNYKG